MDPIQLSISEGSWPTYLLRGIFSWPTMSCIMFIFFSCKFKREISKLINRIRSAKVGNAEFNSDPRQSEVSKIQKEAGSEILKPENTNMAKETPAGYTATEEPTGGDPGAPSPSASQNLLATRDLALNVAPASFIQDGNTYTPRADGGFAVSKGIVDTSFDPEHVKHRKDLYWEFMYLNFYLVHNSKSVLHWITSINAPVSYLEYSAFWMQLVKDPNELGAIINALTIHDLIRRNEQGAFIATDKGKGFLRWIGIMH